MNLKDRKYNAIAFIPARGGSKGIPLKNIKIINGKPLIYWIAKAASKSQNIDAVFVSTDSKEIYKTVESFGLNKVYPIWRSAQSATDTAPTIDAVLEFSVQYDYDTMCLLQATSPLTTSTDIDNGLAIFNEPNTDSVVSCVKQSRFLWQADIHDNAKALNYDYNNRPRRQEFRGYYVENGAMYISSKHAIISSRNFLSGNIKICEMPEETYYEIDSEPDWHFVEHTLISRL